MSSCPGEKRKAPGNDADDVGDAVSGAGHQSKRARGDGGGGVGLHDPYQAARAAFAQVEREVAPAREQTRHAYAQADAAMRQTHEKAKAARMAAVAPEKAALASAKAALAAAKAAQKADLADANAKFAAVVATERQKRQNSLSVA